MCVGGLAAELILCSRTDCGLTQKTGWRIMIAVSSVRACFVRATLINSQLRNQLDEQSAASAIELAPMTPARAQHGLAALEAG